MYRFFEGLPGHAALKRAVLRVACFMLVLGGGVAGILNGSAPKGNVLGYDRR